MPSVIDALIVTLGLDPSGFTKGRKQAESDLGKTRDESVKTAKQIEGQGKKSGEALSGLRREIITLFTAFTAGTGIKEFMRNVTSGDARLGRMSTTLKTSTEELSRWAGIMKSVGGNADSAMNSYANIVSDMEKFALTGNSQVIPYFRALGVHLVDAQGKMKSMTTLFRELAAAIERQKLDPAKALELLRGAGIDDDTARVIIRGTKAIDDLVEAQKRLGAVSKADADAAAKREAAFANLATIATTLGRTILTELSPAIVYVTQKLTDLSEWFANHPREMKAAFAGLAVAATALSAVFLGPFVTGIAALASPIGILVAALAGLAAVGGYFFDDVKEWAKSTLPEFERAWSDIGKAAADVGAALRPTFAAIRGFFGSLGGLARSAGSLIRAVFVGSNADIARAWKRLAGDFSISMTEIKKVGAAVWPIVQRAADAALDGVRRAFSGLSSWLAERFGETGAQIARSLGSSFRVVLDTFGVVKNGFMLLFDLLTGSPEQIKASWSDLKSSLAKMAQDVVTAWRDIGPLIVKGLSAAFDLIGVAWDGLMSLLPESWSRALNAIVNVVGSLVQAVRSVVGLVVAIFVGSNDDIARSWSGLVDDLGAVFSRIVDAATAIWPLILAGAELAIDGIKAAWSVVGDWLEERFGSVGTGIRRAFEGVASAITAGLVTLKNTAALVWQVLTGNPEQIRAAWEELVKSLSGLAQNVAAAWSGLGGIVSDGIQAALKGVEGVVDRVIDYLKGRIKALWDTITDIKMPSWMRAAGDVAKKYNPISIAKDAGIGLYDYLTGNGKKEDKPPLARALGGSVRAGEEVDVGEFGKERFVPRVDGTIIPHSALPKDDNAPAARPTIAVAPRQASQIPVASPAQTVRVAVDRDREPAPDRPAAVVPQAVTPKGSGAEEVRALVSATLIKTFETVAEVGTKTNVLLIRLRDSIDDLDTTIRRNLIAVLRDLTTPLDELSIFFGARKTAPETGGSGSGGGTGGTGGSGDGKPDDGPGKEPSTDEMEWVKRAIAGIESKGWKNPYDARNPTSGAIGKYQVMPANVRSWTKQALGREMTPEEFHKSPEAQEKVFEDQMKRNIKRHGVKNAISIWFSGQPYSEGRAGITDGNMSIRNYVNQAMGTYERERERGLKRKSEIEGGRRDTMPEFAPLPKAAPLPKIPTGAPGSAISNSTSNDNRRTVTNTNSQEINIGSIVTQATDANGVAKDIGPALQRFSTAGDFNYGIA